MRLTGTLSFLDFGPGQWVLATDDGEQLPLYGDIPEDLVNQRVVVRGQRAEAHGIGMTGAPVGVEVSEVSRV